ncbi:MAG: excinuclease ABC subunit UvrB, partial [Eggerthella lenta]
MAHLSNIEGIEMEGKLPEVRLASTPFKVVSPYEPAGDQPQAIEKLATGVKEGLRYQNLLGVTGSGKTFTMAKVIEAVQKPTLVMAPNKTLAAQLASELKEFFPDNAVVYFVSYYDYYQPEAYVPSSDTFIEKDASINEEVEKLRHAATSALLSRRDCIVVASVSCIYGIGSPMDYAGMAVFVDKQKDMDRDQVIHELIDIQYDRNDYEQKRGTFRVRGDALDVFPPYADHPIRIEFWGDEIESITEIDNVTGEVLSEFEALPIWPASHYVTARPKMDRALGTIRDELRERLQQFKEEGKLLEAQRLEMRVNYDLEMLETMNFCSGIENYSRHMDGRARASRPTPSSTTPKDFLCIIDESHVTVPQIRGMHEGDRSRKITLAEHGFRLPSCLDNRPLRFDEFEDRIPQFVYVSATPGDYEQKVSQQQVEQIIRPTGLLDPEIIVRGSASQIDDIIDESKERAARDERVLITTLTKKMAEDLTDHLLDQGVKARYMH